MSYKMIC